MRDKIRLLFFIAFTLILILITISLYLMIGGLQ